MADAKYLRDDIGSLLGHLVEECGEVLAAAGKTQRWGLDSSNPELAPEQRETNRDWLLREMLDVELAISRLRPAISDAKATPPADHAAAIAAARAEGAQHALDLVAAWLERTGRPEAAAAVRAVRADVPPPPTADAPVALEWEIINERSARYEIIDPVPLVLVANQNSVCHQTGACVTVSVHERTIVAAKAEAERIARAAGLLGAGTGGNQ